MGLDHQNHHKDAYLPDGLNGLKVFPKEDSHQCFSDLFVEPEHLDEVGKFLSVTCWLLAGSLS